MPEAVGVEEEVWVETTAASFVVGKRRFVKGEPQRVTRQQANYLLSANGLAHPVFRVVPSPGVTAAADAAPKTAESLFAEGAAGKEAPTAEEAFEEEAKPDAEPKAPAAGTTPVKVVSQEEMEQEPDRCAAVTASGTRCKNKAVGDGPFCKVHLEE